MAAIGVSGVDKVSGSASVKVEDQRKEIVVLNVGGKRFSTSKQTLTWIPDSFFSSLMSGRIPSLRDETGAIFIDRDPDSFGPILNFMRTRSVDLRNVDLKTLRQEAEFFGLIPLVKRLAVCEELERSSCGSLLFYCQIKPAVFDQLTSGGGSGLLQDIGTPHLYSLHSISLVKTDYSRQVLQITGHGNCIAVAYKHCICVLGVRESRGWEIVFTTPPLDRHPQRVCLNTRCVGRNALLAAVIGFEIKVWICSPNTTDVYASFDMKLQVDGLFFIGKQLVAISNTGKVVVWQSVQKHWQHQAVEPICSYDTAGFFLLLGCTNGSIYYIDMEKFPVRMKDNDLLVTQLFEDPLKEPITSLSVYYTPISFPGSEQNWMEVAYGTKAGTVRVVVRHPENIGQAPQIFQSYTVHTCPIMRVVLGEKHLISVCAENHVRTWTVTRFRGRISTQPGSTPIASFKLLSLEGAHSLFYPVNSIGPFGERDDEQVFIQRIIPDTNIIFVRSSSTGSRVCKIESVDGSNISAYYVHECEAINRTGLRSRRFVFTGHLNGTVQVWDLTAALDLAHKATDEPEGGPTKAELLELLQHCDVGTTASLVSSAISSRAPSPSPSLMSILYPSLKQQGGRSSIPASPLSTPLLNPAAAGGSGSNGSSAHSKPPTTLLPSSASSQTLTTMFQPITSRPSIAKEVDAVDLASKQADKEISKAADLAYVAPCSSVEVDENKTTRANLVKPKISLHQQRTFALNNGANGSTRPESDGTLHLRTRSNEMEYKSIGSGDRIPSAFRSPPSSAQVFRPLSFSFHVPGALNTERHPSHSTTEETVEDGAFSSPKAPDASEIKGKNMSVTEKTVTKDGIGDTTNGDDGFAVQQTEKRSSWLNDFNETLWSNYFVTPDQT